MSNNYGYRQIYQYDDANLKQLNDTLRAMWKKVMGGIEEKDLAPAVTTVVETKVIERIIQGEVPDIGAIKTEIMARVEELVDEGMASITTGVIEQMVDEALAELDVPSDTGTQLTQIRAALAGKADAETVDGLRAGGPNLLTGSARLERGSGAAMWSWSNEYDGDDPSDPTGTTLLRDTPISGFNCLRFWGNGLTSDYWSALRSPVYRLPPDWQGRKMTMSAYVYASDWAAVDAFSFIPCLTAGDKTRLFFGSFDVKGNRAAWDLPAANYRWRRISVTFALTPEELSGDAGGSTVFADCTHIMAAFYMRRNGHVRVYAPKLEWGTLPGDWAPAPGDTEASVSALETRMGSAETNIQQNATAISQRALAVDVDALTGRMSTAESSITQQAGQIASKVSQTDFNALGTRMSTAESNITQQAGQIATKVSQTDFNSLGQRVTSAESSITQQAGQIASKVSQQTYDADINNASTGLKKLVSDNTTFRTQTSTYISDFVRSTAWGSPTDNLGNIFTKMWSGVTANREGLTLEAGKLIGSTQLMRRTKGMPASIAELGYSSASDVPSDVDTSSATLWRLSAPTTGEGTVTIDRRAIGYGEYARWITSTGNTSPIWAAIHSPLVSLGGSWVGRQVTFSFYVRSPDWTLVDDALSVYLNLTTGVSAGRLYSGGKTINKTATVEWADTDGLSYELPLRNANWRRASVTFTLSEADIPKFGSHDTAFSACTHAYLSFYLRRNGEVGFRLPKLEWGAKASDWAEASEDVSDSSSAKIKIASDSIMSTVDEKADSSSVTQMSNRLLTTVNKLNNRSDTNIDTAISQVEQTANSWRSVVTTVNGDGTQGSGLVSKVTKIDQSEAFINLRAGKFSNVDDAGVASRDVIVSITPEAFSVTANGENGESDHFDLSATGGKVGSLKVYDELEAPNVAPRYSGPTTLYVDQTATPAQIKSGSYFKTLADVAKEISGKWLKSTVTINLTMASNANEDNLKATFIGIGGPGWINFVGNASAKYRMLASDDHATILEFTDVQNIISISNMTFTTYANTNGNFGIHFANCYFEISNCVFTGPGVSSGGGRGILVNRGARGYVNSCEFYDYEYGVLSQQASEVCVNNSKGNSNLGAIRGRMIIPNNSTIPSRTTPFSSSSVVQNPSGVITYGSNITVNQGTKPTVPTQPSVSTYALTYSDSYSPGNGAWSFAQHNDPMQGYTGGAIIKGCMWFASMSGLSGKTIKSAKIRLYQESGIGRGGSVPITLYGTNTAYSGRTSEPPITKTYGAIGSTNPGETTELSIPTAAIIDLVSGTIQALMIYAPDDQDVYKGRLYSKNYARFRGTTTGNASTKPLITVTYV